MADAPKDKDKKKPSGDKEKTKGPAKGPPNPGMGSGGAPGGISGPPSQGARPPMPGEGVDPYAALAGLISQSPTPPGGAQMGMPPQGMGTPDMQGPGMDMPMGMGPGGDVAGGGGGAGMGMGLAQPFMPGNGPMPGQDPMGQQHDMLTQALMSELNPAAGVHPDLAEHVFDPQQMQGQMSVQQLLQMLALAQGGVPNSGVQPSVPGRNVAGGLFPNEQYMVGG